MEWFGRARGIYCLHNGQVAPENKPAARGGQSEQLGSLTEGEKTP